MTENVFSGMIYQLIIFCDTLDLEVLLIISLRQVIHLSLLDLKISNPSVDWFPLAEKYVEDVSPYFLKLSQHAITLSRLPQLSFRPG